MPARSDSGRRRALLVGPASPVGAAFRAATSAGGGGLAEFGFAAEGEEIGAVIEFAGEPRLVGALEESAVLDADLLILAAAGDGARQALSLARRGRGSVLDLAGIDPEPAAVINMEVNPDRLAGQQPRRVRAPHSAAQLITTAAATLAGAARIERLGATVLLPAAESGADRDARLRMECASVLGLPAGSVTVHALAVPVFQATWILLTVALDTAAATDGWEARFRKRAWKVGATTPAEIGESAAPHVHAINVREDGAATLWIVADLPLSGAAANAARIATALLPAAGARD